MDTISLQLAEAPVAMPYSRKRGVGTENGRSVAAVRPNTNIPGWETLEAQDSHLWMFAIGIMFILGVCLLTVLYPWVFWTRRTVLHAPQALMGISVLLVLMMAYLVQRQ